MSEETKFNPTINHPKNAKKILYVSDGKIKSQLSNPPQVKKASDNKVINQYEKIPSEAGFYFMIRNGGQAPVQVLFDSAMGTYYYRAWDGQRGLQLVDGELLVGPVTDILDLSDLKVIPQDGSSVPSMPNVNNHEQELEDAYSLIAKHERSISDLESKIVNHPAKSKLQDALKQLSVFENSLNNQIQRAFGAETELEQALSEIKDLQDNIVSVAYSDDVAPNTVVLNPEFKNAINKIKMLLVQVKVQSSKTETMTLIDELIQSLDL
ncbi:MAG: hypothetical protein HAW67_00900 [Endozoicomonadaceae bacterium]|nr:hypothetical protein [Endozoicomonadaceae bacterium]